MDSAQFEIQGRGVIVIDSNSSDESIAQEGYAVITTDDDIAVEAIFSLFNSAGSLLTTTSVLPRPAADAGTVILKVDASNAVAGNIAVVNPASNGEAATINATLRDAFGNSLGTVDIGPLAAGAKTAAIWTELFTDLAGADGFAGTIEWTSNFPVISLPLLQTGLELITQDNLPPR